MSGYRRPDNIVMVPLIRFTKPRCTCDDVASTLNGGACPAHFPEEHAAFGGGA